MARHLIAVKVRIVTRADKGMQFDCPAFPQNRFKRLDAEAVECRSAVKKYGMFFNNIAKDVPDFRGQLVHFFPCRFQIARQTAGDQFMHDERFEKFDRHFFRQAALVHFQFRTDYDNRTARIVDTFPQKVLAETALLAFQHIGKGFQGTVSRAADRSAAAAVIYEGIDSFLQHTFFISDDDFRRAHVHQSFQTVISVDDTAVKVVQVARSKTPAVKLHHRAEVRRYNGQHGEDHPFRLIARFTESFHFFQPADAADFALVAAAVHIFAKLFFQGFQIQLAEKLLNSFRPHLRLKRTGAVFLDGLLVFLFI